MNIANQQIFVGRNTLIFVMQIEKLYILYKIKEIIMEFAKYYNATKLVDEMI